ncbi:MAG: hypothetical protein ACLPHI_06685 [Terriglobales bacterium]|jgi:hypothetical protein
MAARHIPIRENASTLNITITANDATPEGSILTPQQTSVEFYNNSGTTISIAFTPAGVLTNVNNLLNGQTSTPQSMPANTSVNYSVTIGGVINPLGPFAIQAGTGAMVVTVSGTTDITCSPDPVAIPAGGNLMMKPAVSTNNYPVGWDDGDPFTVPITRVDSASHTDDPVNGGPGYYPYTVTEPSPLLKGGGGGTVIIRST